jgi:uncharacterized repeat protein (TIGR03843 family)
VRTEGELLAGELLIEGRLIDASNATLFGVIKTGISTEINVVYKPIAGERPLWDFTTGNLASREVAAYLVSEVAGFHCVPTTVLREGPFGLGAVQQWIDTSAELDVISLAQSDNQAIRKMALFDVVINNTDRKFGHILPMSEDEILGCDHGVSFHEDFKLRTVVWQFAGKRLEDRELAQLERLKKWIYAEGVDVLSTLLTEVEIAALVERTNKLSMDGFPFPSEDWPAVPWPPV